MKKPIIISSSVVLAEGSKKASITLEFDLIPILSKNAQCREELYGQVFDLIHEFITSHCPDIKGLEWQKYLD